ncbi:PfkB family carbohydrate kinase [Muricomes intestini]|uniref:PfkB family carbohydrate kinase n=1 Tax=Muricomes intestini TaxID=1796634 RepID=UPI002FE32D62
MNIRDIARLAGVSTSTVSKIVNQKDGSISSATRQRVLKIVQEYNYAPYASHARRSAKTWLIGILLNSSVSLDTTLDGIMKVAQENGYWTLVFNNYSDTDQELKNITALCKMKMDGVIWEPVTEKSLEFANYFEDLKIPVVTIGPNGGNSAFLLPYEEASYRITQELIKRGHSHIACLVKQSRRAVPFVNGYKKCLFDHHLKMDKELIFSDLNHDLVQKVCTHRVTGIIFSHYRKAMEFYQRMIRLGYTIPEDVSLISLRNDTLESISSPEISEISSCMIRNSDFGSYICNKIIADIERKPGIPPSFVQNLHLNSQTTIGIPFDQLSPKITVVGSIHLDTFLYASQLPQKEKTTPLTASLNFAGGKGVNQSIGAAKLGHRVTLIGNVGSDVDSDRIYQALAQYGVETSGVQRCSNTDTGRAYIFVDSSGTSMISVLPGANDTLTAEEIRKRYHFFKNTGYCLIQGDIPAEAISEACKAAHKYGAKIILKPSAFRKIPEEILKSIDILALNERELSNLCPGCCSSQQQPDYLLGLGIKAFILSLGQRGYLVKTSDWEEHFQPPDFRPLDNTGADDAFISALASYLLYGYDLRGAVRIAAYAAGFCNAGEGVINSLVDRARLEAYIRQRESGLLHLPRSGNRIVIHH